MASCCEPVMCASVSNVYLQYYKPQVLVWLVYSPASVSWVLHAGWASLQIFWEPRGFSCNNSTEVSDIAILFY